MQNYQQAFIQFCLDNKVICFGDFTLKSGRKSPYFFNTGLFNTGQSLHELGKFYAQTIIEANIDFDVIFGPAYKGIPLATSTAIALSEIYNIDKPVCFNRKVAKDHGEKGNIVGANLEGNILMIDDVITVGTTVQETIEIINAHHAKLDTIVVALDRQEKNQGDASAMQAIEKKFSIHVISIITLDDIIEFLESSNMFPEYLDKINDYRNE